MTVGAGLRTGDQRLASKGTVSTLSRQLWFPEAVSTPASEPVAARPRHVEVATLDCNTMVSSQLMQNPSNPTSLL